uniref:Uncharacterized protein n=1 Tax=Anguilla anguilla TaxID=7936 RepID=A0A0E9XDI2_ANGAN
MKVAQLYYNSTVKMYISGTNYGNAVLKEQ